MEENEEKFEEISSDDILKNGEVEKLTEEELENTSGGASGTYTTIGKEIDISDVVRRKMEYLDQYVQWMPTSPATFKYYVNVNYLAGRKISKIIVSRRLNLKGKVMIRFFGHNQGGSARSKDIIVKFEFK